LPPETMVHKNAPNGADFLPVGIEIKTNALNDLWTALQYAHNVAEWLPPVLKVVFSRIIRYTIEFEAECFNLRFPSPEGDHKVTLGGKLDDTRVRAE
jgi:hypothetical protein